MSDATRTGLLSAPHASAFHPAASGEARAGAGKPLPADEISAGEKAKPRVLVVDDAPDVAEMITLLLRHAGYEVETALGARAALDAVRSGRFDAVVSDIGMPEMNGYELAECLRAMPEYAAVPLIAVTGFTMYDDRERAISAGFDGFLTKPINTQDLLDTLERLRG